MSDRFVVRHPDADALSADVAHRLLALIEDVQQEGRAPQIVLTGGTIADEIHREVARLTPSSAVDWSRVGVWWGDERFTAPDSPDRNALQARHALLDTVGVDPAKVHEIPSTADAADVDEAAAAYAEEVRSSPAERFDVVMLGLGRNGHVASLCPGHPGLDVTDRVAVGVWDSPKPPPTRVTLTFPTLNRTAQTWFVVAGESKAEATARALADDGDVHDTPARGAHGALSTTWFLDDSAASALPPAPTSS